MPTTAPKVDRVVPVNVEVPLRTLPEYPCGTLIPPNPSVPKLSPVTESAIVRVPEPNDGGVPKLAPVYTSSFNDEPTQKSPCDGFIKLEPAL